MRRGKGEEGEGGEGGGEEGEREGGGRSKMGGRGGCTCTCTWEDSRRKDHIVRMNLFSKLRSVQWGIIVYVGRD